jgi:hypothetical protein
VGQGNHKDDEEKEKEEKKKEFPSGQILIRVGIARSPAPSPSLEISESENGQVTPSQQRRERPDALNFVFDVFAKGMKDDGPPWKVPAGSQSKPWALSSADETADLSVGVPEPHNSLADRWLARMV